MAQGVMAQALPGLNPVDASTASTLTAEELREILEYDRIVQFRDSVLAGTHPRVKIPPHLVGKPLPPPLHPLSANSQTASIHSQPPSNHVDSNADSSNNNSTVGYNSANVAASKNGGNNTEINPIFLQKSEDLIKAEIRLQRERLERGLREQIEQQRIAAKAASQTSEALPGFDLSEVLSKALAIVGSSTDTVNASGDGRSSASDSFDERTFYSSQHDTPMSSSSRGRQEVNGLHPNIAASPSSQRKHSRSANSSQAQAESGVVDVIMSNTASRTNDNTARGTQFGGTDTSSTDAAVPSSSRNGSTLLAQFEGSGTSATSKQFTAAPSTFNGQSQKRHGTGTSNHAGKGVSDTMVNHPPSPLVRAHNLSPFAPQPARVSPLVTTRDIPGLLEVQHENAQPAQVAALRQVASGLSSTDSSPKADQSARKKKKKEKNKGKAKDKEKKRKAKDRIPASPDSPYIKPEPQSPEPFASLPRPQKRQRQSGNFSAGLTYDDPEIIDRRPQAADSSAASRVYSQVEEGHGYERPRPSRIYRDADEPVRVREARYRDEPTSPIYISSGANQLRPSHAASRSTVETSAQEESLYYQKPMGRPSVRPETFRGRSRSPNPGNSRDERNVLRPPPKRVMRVVIDEYGYEHLEAVTMAPPLRRAASPISSQYERGQAYDSAIQTDIDRQRPMSTAPRDGPRTLMGPPKKAMHVIRDEFGNEYLEPISDPIPSERYKDSEVRHERAVSRAVSTRLPAEVYDGQRVVYRQASPPLPRRVVTQPEFVAREDDHRAYRQREYSVRPSAAPEQFVEIRAPSRRVVSHYDEPVREVIRQATVRPGTSRYEIAEGYTPRLHSVRPEESTIVRRELPPQARAYSVRPEAPPREYAMSVRPEGKGDYTSQPQREYSTRPVEVIRRRVFDPAQGEYFYEEIPVQRPAEVRYIERPSAREGSVMVYADDMRREVYR